MSIALAALAVLAQAAPAAQATAQATAQAPAQAPAQPKPAGDLVPEVEVVARRPVVGDLQQGINAYRPEFFLPVRPGTALDMVNWLPGFVFEDTRDARGLEGSTGNVLIDGKPPTSKTDTLQSVLRRIPASQVERIDIIVGSSPGIEMHGRNIIANVVLKAAATKRRVVTAQTILDKEGRLTPQLQLSTSQKSNGRVVEAAIDLSRNTGIFPGYGYGSWVRTDGSGAEVLRADTSNLAGGPSIIGSAAYEQPLAGGTFRVNGLLRRFGTTISEDDVLIPGPGAYTFRYQQVFQQQELGLRYERKFGRRSLELQWLERPISFTSKVDNRRPPAPSIFDTDGSSLESIARATLRFKRDDTFSLETSAEGAVNTSKNVSRSTVGGVAVVLPAANVEVEEQRAELGTLATWKPDAKLSLDGALKLEMSNLTASRDVSADRSLTYLKPKLALAWSPRKTTQVRLRAEHEVGQLDLGYFLTSSEYNSGAVRAGNPNLRPQRSLVGEAVFEQDFWSGGSLVLTVRRRELRDVIDVVPIINANGNFTGFANIGSGSGQEYVANLTVPLKPLGLNGTIVRAVVTRNDVLVTDPTDGRRRQQSGTPNWIAEAHLAQDLPRWKFNWGIDAFYRAGSALYRPFGNEEVHDWVHVNVFAEYRFTPQTTFRVEVQNLPGQHPLQRISVYGGPRDRTPVSYVDEKRLTNGPLLLLRLRRTFE